MAESKIESTVVLTLSVREAYWLKVQLQNAQAEETLLESTIRENLFNSLPAFDTLRNL